MADTAGKPIKCKAAVAWEQNKPLSIETVEVGPPKAGEVRVKIVATGVCHTDANTLDGCNPAEAFPCILGHEGAGIVESIGEGVTSVKPGDHVIPCFVAQCRNCEYCKNKKTNLCSKLWATQYKGLMPDGTTRFTCNGKQVYHYMGTSTFSEYTVTAEISLAKIPDNCPMDKVCLLGCGISTGYGAVLKTAAVEAGSVVAIWGLGGIGLAVAMGCREVGASRVIGIDVNPEKFQVAKKFGCTEFVNPKDHDRSIQEVVIEMTNGGPDYTFECVGTVQAMVEAFESCHKGWGMSVVIGVAPAGQKVSTVPIQLVRGRTWTGTGFGDWKGRDDIPELVDRYMTGKIMVDEFVTFDLPLDKINESFDLMHAGKAIRSVIHM